MKCPKCGRELPISTGKDIYGERQYECEGCGKVSRIPQLGTYTRCPVCGCQLDEFYVGNSKVKKCWACGYIKESDNK